jgi:peptidylprolyl isomerase
MSRVALCAVLIATAVSGPAPAQDADPENTLYVDLDHGRVVIHMRPDWAPKHVARIKHLVRGGYYDGMLWHRVIDDFVAQTGDPTGTGSGGSGRALEAEYTRTPLSRGIVAMARGSGKKGADSQWFIVLGNNSSSFDGKYTAWGRVTEGMEFVARIKKGNANSGKVTDPDRLIKMWVAADADAASTASVSDAEALAQPDATAVAREFSGTEFRCSAIGGNLALSPQPALARLWAHGFLAGAYKAQDKLTFAADAPADAISTACAAAPALFLLGVSGGDIAKAPRPLAATVPAFAAADYRCKDYAAARSGSSAEAEFADLWSFAFIQGYKAIGQPGLEFPFDSKPQLLGAIAATCAKNPDLALAELAAMVAAKVKLK